MYKGIHEKHNHCLEDCLLTYMLYKGIPHCYMFMDSWKFYCEPYSIEVFGGEEHNSSFPHQETVEGIMKIHKLSLSNPSLEQINELIKNNVFLIIHYDAYLCDWSIAYKRYHMQHYFIVNNVDGEKLIVSDPYLNNKRAELLFNDIQNNNAELIIISGGISNIDYDVVKKQVLKTNQDMFDQINQFGINLEQISVSEYGKQYKKDITESLLYQNITYIVNSRFNLSKLFYYLSRKKCNYDLEAFANEFLVIANEWELIKNKIIKMMISDSLYKRLKTDIKCSIFDVAKKEESLYKKLQLS